MYHLISILIGVALAGALALQGVQYITSSSLISSRISGVCDAGISSLASSMGQYRSVNGVYPETATWETELVPTYLAGLPPSGDGAWVYEKTASGAYVCLLVSPGSQSAYDGLARSASHLGGAAHVGNSCGLTATEAYAGGDAALTYWLP